ncbi:sulfate permease, SulP family [Marchantia polymorpha subsp. ruderalis]|uniref:STAS domain-containing protein n=2 Tax=Marchantia polymorpha TaxID=3197 RepID=A0AAF6AS69_MARPO|nr:hypothetical protein MARPO_0001s0357 [Marchantia polymorpha]BBM99289.1 hypothetical protein Mp_1g20200 [Marchantia polymorpha subsp. ruderalis]|eukprot:PTQ50371.1 hypothetical protein MARPO_0001s0357 [Marchantia polymorpha]
MYASNSLADFQSNPAEKDRNITYNRVVSIGRDCRTVKVLPIEHDSQHDWHESPSSSPHKSESEPFNLASWWKRSSSTFLVRLLPCIVWLRAYKWKEDLKADVVAGITVGTMLIPQSMSYAKLAGLHPIYGLYSGFIPVIAYAFFGSSRQLAVGSVAMVSLLVSNGIMPIVSSHTSSPEEAAKLYVELAIHLAFLVGVIECLMGLVRLGWLIRFISHSVVSGFTTGSAIIIGLSQAKSFLGYEVSNSSHLSTIVKSIIDGIDQFKWQPFAMGSVTLAVLLVMKHMGKNYKRFRHLRAAGPLSAVVLGVAFVKVFKPTSISVVGEIPQGFPAMSLKFDFTYSLQLLPHAALVSGVAILESVGIAKALASKNGYEIDSNQELFGLGIANLFGTAFSAYPVTGSFSRSAVSNDSGAKSGLFGVVVFLLVGAALLFLTPIFTDIPQCGLAAIVISAVIGLVDYDEAIFLWRVDKRDLLLWMTTFVFTLLNGIEVGVLIGVGLSLVFVIYESANPHTAVLGRLPGTTVYRNTQQYPEALTYHGIVIMRIDAPIYFANTTVIKDRLRSCEHYRGNNPSRGAEQDRIYFVIFEMSPVTYIDSSAVHAIKELYHDYTARGIQLAICNPNRKVMLSLARGGVRELIGHDWYFVRVHDAVQTCMSILEAKPLNPASSDVESQAQTEDSQASSQWLGDSQIQVPLLLNTSVEERSRGN